jgi:hypothetical protein
MGPFALAVGNKHKKEVADNWGAYEWSDEEKWRGRGNGRKQRNTAAAVVT